MNNLFRQVSYVGVKEDMRFETKRKIILLNRLSVILFLIVFTLRTVVLSLGLQDFSFKAMMPYFGIAFILLIPLFNKYGFYKLNSFVFCIVVPTAFLFFGVISQTTNTIVNINHYYIPRVFILGSLVLPLILIDTKSKVLLFIAILVNVTCILLFDTVVNHIGVPFDPTSVSFQKYEIIAPFMLLPAALMIAGFLFLVNLNKQYEDQIIGLNKTLSAKNIDLQKNNDEITLHRDVISDKNKELELSNEEITSQRDLIAKKNMLLEYASKKNEQINRQLTDSILYAKSIQKAVLGSRDLPEKYFTESFIFFRPKQNVSGDFYYHKEHVINNKPCLVVAAADCTGHGVPGGFLSMLGITLINEIVQNESISNAADVLNHLREKTKSTLNQTGNIAEQNDGMEMALCIYYPQNKRMDYAGAKNPLYIVAENGDVNVVKGDRQPIGAYLREEAFTNHHLEFEGGEMIYIFSDGMQDQFGGPEGKKMKLSNLQKLMKSIAKKSGEEQKEDIERYLSNWIYYTPKAKYEQIDDIVFIGMRV